MDNPRVRDVLGGIFVALLLASICLGFAAAVARVETAVALESQPDFYPILQTETPRVLVQRLVPYEEAAEYLDRAPLTAITGITGERCPAGWVPHTHGPDWEAVYIPFGLRVNRDGSTHDDEGASLLLTCERAR